MKKLRLGWTLVLVILIAGCARAPDVTLDLRVDSEDAAVVEDARRILMLRFGEFPASFFSNIESTIDGSVISFRFTGGAPKSSTLTYLHQTRGRLRASMTESSAPLFTDRDIEQADRVHDENVGSVIALRLTPAAGERVFALTTRNVGKTVRVTLDGRPLVAATITGPLRDSLQITSTEQDREKAMALIAILRSGALPAQVSVTGQTP